MSVPEQVPCVSCGSTSGVAWYVFECDDGRLIDRPLCLRCVPPEPMRYAAWLDWAYAAQQHEGL